ncbi:MAG: hypothetical protein K0S08_1415 [Gammaproteobacteria bacterium]|jgi:hypothetical protein|nr:hypothetical protein [Gammaproteobacteria bacterium]
MKFGKFSIAILTAVTLSFSGIAMAKTKDFEGTAGNGVYNKDSLPSDTKKLQDEYFVEALAIKIQQPVSKITGTYVHVVKETGHKNIYFTVNKRVYKLSRALAAALKEQAHHAQLAAEKQLVED